MNQRYAQILHRYCTIPAVPVVQECQYLNATLLVSALVGATRSCDGRVFGRRSVAGIWRTGLAWITPRVVPWIMAALSPSLTSGWKRTSSRVPSMTSSRLSQHGTKRALLWPTCQEAHYAQVRSAARQLASQVRAAVPAGKAVAVLLPNQATSLIAALACFAAGRVCLLLNAEHSPERNRVILHRAAVAAVIVANDDGASAALIPADAVASLRCARPLPRRRSLAASRPAAL
jgi:non-ribosomal peptide synthetase component F